VANAGDEAGDEMSPESRRELHAVLETSETEIAAGAPTTTIDELREEWRREDLYSWLQPKTRSRKSGE
jgi:hypothetical protein